MTEQKITAKQINNREKTKDRMFNPLINKKIKNKYNKILWDKLSILKELFWLIFLRPSPIINCHRMAINGYQIDPRPSRRKKFP